MSSPRPGFLSIISRYSVVVMEGTYSIGEVLFCIIVVLVVIGIIRLFTGQD